MKELDLSAEGFISILVQGITGSGKTNFCGTAMETGTTAYFYADDKPPTTLRQKRFIDAQKSSNSKILQPDDSNDLIKYLTALNGDSGANYDTCILDSLSRYQMFTQLDLLEGTKVKESNGNAVTKVNKPKDRMTQDDWNRLGIRMNRTMRLIPKNKMNIICTAQSMESLMKTGNNEFESKLKPALTGSFANLIGGWFDIVAFMRALPEKNSEGKDIITYRMYFQPGYGYEAKSEYDLPEYIDNPSFGNLLKLINGGE